MAMEHFDDLQSILENITLPNGWTLEALDYVFAPIWFIRVRCDGGKCNTTDAPMDWRGRKWYVSQYSTPSEVVQTAFKAVLTAMEHEAREQFLYKGIPVLCPHQDLDAMVTAERSTSVRAPRSP